MRNSLWLACLLFGLSGSCDATAPNLDSLRCPDSPTMSSPDTPAGGSDTSLFGSLTRDNNYNCIKNPNICASLGANFSCEMTQGCCREASLGRCSKSADCRENTTPVCDLSNNICVACSTSNPTLGDQQCSEWNKTQSDPLNRRFCFSGHCGECHDNTDCTRVGKTFCDQADNICKGCTNNSQCTGSNICKLDESLLATGDSLTNIGECVKATDVAFVDNNATLCASADGSSGNPYCQIVDALSAAKPFSYINVIGRGSDTAHVYQPVNVSKSGQRVVILGPGRDVIANQQAVINGVTVTGGAQVTLIDISVTNATSTQPAVQCNSSGTVYAQKVLITNTPYIPAGGIYASNCSKVVVEKTKVNLANGYGVSISGGSGHRVVNNALIYGGSGLEQYGLRLTGAADGLFAFNTISKYREGIQCDNQQTVTDTIVYMSGAGITGCQQARNVTSNVVLDTGAGNDPKLMTEMNNVVDKGMPDSNKFVKDDYFSAKRPLGSGYDIGFQEVR